MYSETSLKQTQLGPNILSFIVMVQGLVVDHAPLIIMTNSVNTEDENKAILIRDVSNYNS